MNNLGTTKELNIYKALVSALPQSIFLLDRDKIIVGIYNATPQTLAGFTVEDIVGNSILKYANDPDSPFNQACIMLNQTYDTVWATDKTLKFQFSILDSHMEATITKVMGDMVMSQVQDISEIIEKQQQIEHRKHAELAMAMVAGGITTWNYDVATSMLSSQNNNNVIVEAMSLDQMIAIILDEHRQKTREMFDDLIIHGKKHAHITVQVVNHDGNIQWSDVHAIPHEYDQNGAVLSIIGSQKDITEEYESQERLRILLEQNQHTLVELAKAKEAAEQSDKLKSAFLANMSHEIRTPLNSIVGFAQLIPEAEDAQTQQEYINIVNSNSEILLNIINDILDLSKIEAGFFNYNNVHFDMKSLFGDLNAIFKHKMRPGVELKLSLPAHDQMVNMDRMRVSQIVSNFMTNAIKFTRVGHITMGFQVTDVHIKIFVEDTGIGMSRQELLRVFERFEKFNAHEQGTGLGTSIAKGIVEAYKGKIGVESTKGMGTTFWATIPLSQVECKKE